MTRRNGLSWIQLDVDLDLDPMICGSLGAFDLAVWQAVVRIWGRYGRGDTIEASYVEPEYVARRMLARGDTELAAVRVALSKLTNEETRSCDGSVASNWRPSPILGDRLLEREGEVFRLRGAGRYVLKKTGQRQRERLAGSTNMLGSGPIVANLGRRSPKSGDRVARGEESRVEDPDRVSKKKHTSAGAEELVLTPPAGKPEHAAAKRIFGHWQKVMNHPHALLSPDRLRKILARLGEGASETLCMQAVDGCRASKHHMGDNDSGTVYDSIGLIFRNREFLEKFAARAERPTDPEHERLKAEHAAWLAKQKAEAHGATG